MRIQSLSIQNFRGFERFEMKDLGRINLIVGTNNSGKTTVLEALSILMAHGNPSAVWTVLNRRGEVIWVEHEEPATGTSKFYEAQQLFRGFETRVGTCFRLAADTETGAVEMVAKVGDPYRPTHPHGSPSELLPASLPQEFLTPLSLSLSWSNDGTREFDFPISPRGLVSTVAIGLAARVVPENGSTLQWISSSALTPDEVAALFSDVVLTPDEDVVTEAVRIIEPTIERLGSAMSRRTMSGVKFPRPASTFVRLEGIKDRISMRGMGEGIWHLLSVALALVHARDGLLLVDDVDTGLHHTVMEDMWKFLDAASKTYNVQVFATTHSRDCYESLAAIAKKSDSDTSEVTIQRIERGREQAVAYHEGHILAAAKHDIEVR